MGGSSPGKSLTQESKGPWAPAEPQLGQILSDAKSLYDSNAGSKVYGGERYAGLGDTTLSGIGLLKANAGPSAATTAGTDFATGLLGTGGASADTSADLGQMRTDLGSAAR